MKAQIEITKQYGFAHYWNLVLTKRNGEQKSFFLGQDVKFCDRVLGMSPSYIVEQIGSNEITEPKINTRLANFILDTLNISKKDLFTMNGWELSAE